MPSPRVPILTILAFAIAGTLPAAEAAPYRPSQDTEILERLPAPNDPQQRELRRLRAEISANPGNLPSALGLARRYLAIGRAEGDPRYTGYAEAALSPWIRLESPPTEILVLRAIIHQSRHAFDAAIEDLDRVLAERPGHAQARLSQAFILQAQGRLAEAGEHCRQLPDTIGRLIVATCNARVASLTGDAAGALASLETAVAGAGTADDGLRLWALTNLAEVAERLGDRQTAERRFREALALDRRDTYLLGAYADFLLDTGRPADARRLLADETRNDGLLLRLAIAEKALGDARYEAHAAALADRFEAGRRRGDLRHLREEARFELQVRDDPAAALELALENWRTQREPADLRLVLEAASAADAPNRAAGVLRWIDRTGFEDLRLTGTVAALRRRAG